MVCPYSVLGISKSSNVKEVKKAYYRLAMKYHPDRNRGSDDTKFKEINEAYMKIINNNDTSDFTDESPFSKFTGIDFSNLLQNLKLDQFGGIMNDIHLFHDYYQKRKNTFGKDAKKSDTYYIHVRCKIEDIYNGKVKDVTVDVDISCRICLGLGKKSDITSETNFIRCESCDGKGLVKNTETLSLYLDRKVQLFGGLGNNAIDLKRGDIEVSILPKPHNSFYIYDDYNLGYNVNVIKGAKTITVPHFQEDIIIDISQITNTLGNKKICKKELGLFFPIGYSKKRGDLIIVLNIFESNLLQEDEDRETYSLVLE
jgi:DnaJ-class molecular chaperone